MDRPVRGPRRAGVQSLDRAFELLDVLADADGDVGLSQLALAAQLPMPTTHRIVRSLVSAGYVVQLPTRRYTLGPRLIGLGESAGRMLDAWARRQLAHLAESAGETANLAMLDGDMVVYVAQAPSSRHTMRMFTEVGRRVFPHCTGVGKALLAGVGDDTVREMLGRVGMPVRTDRTITDPDAFTAELALVRARGYAVDDGEQEQGVRCVAVALPGNSKTAISVSGPAGRLTADSFPTLVPLLRSAADGLSGQSGGVAAQEVGRA